METASLIGGMGGGSAGIGMGSGLGTGISGIGSIIGGIQANSAAKRNAKLLERIGELEADQERRNTRALMGAQRAAVGASGFDPSSGSFLDLVASTAVDGEVRAMRIAFARETEADAQRQEGHDLLFEGILGGTSQIAAGAFDFNKASTQQGGFTPKGQP